MRSILRERWRAELHDRASRLTPEHTGRWGRMDAPAMLAHITEWMRMAQGELRIPMRRLVVRHAPIKQLLIYFAPMPRGLPTAPELRVRCEARTPEEWREALAVFGRELERTAARDRADPWPLHPAFGRLSRHAWGVLAYRHTDHHLRQFGL